MPPPSSTGQGGFRPYGPQSQLPAAWRYHDLAFFCRIEHRLARRSGLPIIVRLGDVDYVDYLEGKRWLPPTR